MVAGLAVALFAAAVLLMNNHRDCAEDAKAGHRTLAIAVGHLAPYAVFAALMPALEAPPHN